MPVNGDFEEGFAVEPAEVANNVALAATTGVAGLSIEDSTGDAGHPLYDFSLAVERVRAARRALDESGRDVLLTGRSEGFMGGRSRTFRKPYDDWRRSSPRLERTACMLPVSEPARR